MVNDRVHDERQITFYIMSSLLAALAGTRIHIKRERAWLDNRLTVCCSMRFPKMAKFVAIVAIVLLASAASQSQRIIRETPTLSAGEKYIIEPNKINLLRNNHY